MKVYAIYDKSNKFIIAFPTREETENYGKVFLGNDKGWEYDIKEMCLVHQLLTSPSYSQPLQPLVVPYTKQTTPYEQHIWTCKDGPTTTFAKKGPLGPTGIPGPSGHISAVGIEGLQGPKKIHSFPVDSGPFAPGTK